MNPFRKFWEKITDHFPGKTAPISWRFGIRDRAVQWLQDAHLATVSAAIKRAGHMITLADGSPGFISSVNLVCEGFRATANLIVYLPVKVADATGKPRFQRTCVIDWRDVRREWTTGRLFEKDKRHDQNS